MAEAQVVESVAEPEVKAEAEKMGWIPDTRYRGDPEKFVDADEYLKRGELVLPIIKKTNQNLRDELNSTRAEAKRLAEQQKLMEASIEEMRARHVVEKQKAVAEARAQARADLAKASEEGDHVQVAVLTDKLVDLAKEEAVAVAPPKKTAPAEWTPPTVMTEWNAENPWFGTDTKRTALAVGIAQELKDAGEKPGTREFFELVKEKVDEILPFSPQQKEDKVAPARQSGNSSSVKPKSFAAMPADAKAECNAEATNFVGKDKAFKTKEEWQSHYATIYWEQ